jgi:hypothetical protein
MVMPPALCARIGHPRHQIFIILATKLPTTQSFSSHLELDQKATITGTIWEKS